MKSTNKTRKCDCINNLANELKEMLDILYSIPHVFNIQQASVINFIVGEMVRITNRIDNIENNKQSKPVAKKSVKKGGKK